MGSRTIAAALFVFSLATYVIFSYGGVRSPDSEVVFRTAEALATRGSFALEDDLEFWPGFGARAGLDGRRYSVLLRPTILSSRAADASLRCSTDRSQYASAARSSSARARLGLLDLATDR